MRFDLLGKAIERERIRYVRSALSEQVCDFLVAVAVSLDEQRERLGLFERREIFALQVLDECQLQGVVTLADQCRDAVEARNLRSPQSALAGEQLVTGLGATQDDGLQQPSRLDRRR